MLSCAAAKDSRTSIGQAGPIDVPPPSQPTQGTADFEEPECHPDVTCGGINIIVIDHYRRRCDSYRDHCSFMYATSILGRGGDSDHTSHRRSMPSMALAQWVYSD